MERKEGKTHGNVLTESYTWKFNASVAVICYNSQVTENVSRSYPEITSHVNKCKFLANFANTIRLRLIYIKIKDRFRAYVDETRCKFTKPFYFYFENYIFFHSCLLAAFFCVFLAC